MSKKIVKMNRVSFILVTIILISSLFSIEALAMSPQAFNKKLDEWSNLGPEASALAGKANSAMFANDTANACKYQKQARDVAKKGIALGKELIRAVNAGILDNIEGTEDEKQQLRTNLVQGTGSAERGLINCESVIKELKCR